MNVIVSKKTTIKLSAHSSYLTTSPPVVFRARRFQKHVVVENRPVRNYSFPFTDTFARRAFTTDETERGFCAEGRARNRFVVPNGKRQMFGKRRSSAQTSRKHVTSRTRHETDVSSRELGLSATSNRETYGGNRERLRRPRTCRAFRLSVSRVVDVKKFSRPPSDLFCPWRSRRTRGRKSADGIRTVYICSCVRT